MTKKELNEAVLAACVNHGASDELKNALDELTKPKVGGGSSDVNDYTVFDEDGQVTHVFCTFHKKWEPVEDEEGEALFKDNAKSKNGLERECIDANRSWRNAQRVFKSTERGIISDLLEGEISNDDAKELIATAEENRLTRAPREDGLGVDEKPEGFTVATE